MSVHVKICGLTSFEGVRTAVLAGADAVGFVLSESPRRIDPAWAADLARSLPERVVPVAVFRHASRDRVREVFRLIPSCWLQVDIEDIPRLEIPSGRRILPVVRDVRGAAHRIADYRIRCGRRRPRILFEGARSGCGESVNLDRAAEHARSTRLVLAGGLSPGNVVAAVEKVRPYAVDVSSGVEISSGVKDPLRIAAFVRALRRGEGGIRGMREGGAS